MHKLGRLLATPGVLAAVPADQLLSVVCRHAAGDWGELCDEDQQANEDALACGARLLSVYIVESVKVWVITEADRSVTTVLLPEEY
jgi:hypothetical protein